MHRGQSSLRPAYLPPLQRCWNRIPEFEGAPAFEAEVDCCDNRAASWSAKPPVRSSVKPSHSANDNLIERTRQLWQPRASGVI